VIRPHQTGLSQEKSKSSKKKNRPTLSIKKQGLLFIRPAGKNTSSSGRSQKINPRGGGHSFSQAGELNKIKENKAVVVFREEYSSAALSGTRPAGQQTELEFPDKN
jgi:hypothetical protein